MLLDSIFSNLIDWLSSIAEKRFGRLAGCLAVLVLTGLFVLGIWIAIISLT